MVKHGWHWPREEQHANAFEEFGDLAGDDAAASAAKANWQALLPPFISPQDPARPEFDNVEEVTTTDVQQLQARYGQWRDRGSEAGG